MLDPKGFRTLGLARIDMPMKSKSRTQKQIVAENKDLRARLDEAEEILRAIRSGAVDALIVSGVGGEHVFTFKQVEQALWLSEEKYRMLVDELNDGLFVTDSAGVFTFVNPALARIYGVESPQALVGRKFSDFIAPEILAQLGEARRSPMPAERAPEVLNGQIVRPDGICAFIEVKPTSIVEGGQIVGSRGVVRDITERKRAEQALARSHEDLRVLNIYWQNAIEAQRTQIARELHDDLGQSLSLLKMDLLWLAHHLPQGDEKVERIDTMVATVDGSIAQMRRVATDLRPRVLDDLGLNAALEWQAQEFSKRTGIPCFLILPNDDLGLEAALNTTLFRIFQEALTNILRHAQATRIDATFREEGTALILTVQDNGLGIRESGIQNSRSLGLLGMHERVAQWGGSLTIRGTPGEGTTVTCSVPLPVPP